MIPPILTAFYAGLAALVVLSLTWAVIRRRRKDRIVHGDGGDKAMAKLIRGHANATETIPLALILLGLTEAMGAPASAVHVAGATLVIGRVFHALHFAGKGPFIFRPIGMGATLLVIAVLAIGLIAHALSQGL